MRRITDLTGISGIKTNRREIMDDYNKIESRAGSITVNDKSLVLRKKKFGTINSLALIKVADMYIFVN
jgi:hypothetical protein